MYSSSERVVGPAVGDGSEVGIVVRVAVGSGRGGGVNVAIGVVVSDPQAAKSAVVSVKVITQSTRLFISHLPA